MTFLLVFICAYYIMERDKKERNSMASETFIERIEPFLAPDRGSIEDARQALIHLARPYEREPWRAHHNVTHLNDMVDYLLPVADNLDDPVAVFGAVVGHDTVYQPWLWNKKAANEALSRMHTDYFLSPYYSPQRRQKIGHYIMATVEHPNAKKDPDLAEFLDADMSVLGASDDRNRQYADAVKEEYVQWGGLSEKAFLDGRVAFLKAIDEKRIFITERAQDLYESQAHRNIGAEVVRIEMERARL